GVLGGLDLGLEEVALAGAVQLTDQEPQQIERGVAPQGRRPLGHEVAQAGHDPTPPVIRRPSPCPALPRSPHRCPPTRANVALIAPLLRASPRLRSSWQGRPPARPATG